MNQISFVTIKNWIEYRLVSSYPEIVRRSSMFIEPLARKDSFTPTLKVIQRKMSSIGYLDFAWGHSNLNRKLIDNHIEFSFVSIFSEFVKRKFHANNWSVKRHVEKFSITKPKPFHSDGTCKLPERWKKMMETLKILCWKQFFTCKKFEFQFVKICSNLS